MPREMTPGARGLLGVTVAVLCFLLLVGAVEDLGLGRPGLLLLGGAVLSGCAAGLVWSLREPRRTPPWWWTMSLRKRMSLGFAIFLPVWSLLLAAQRIWNPLAVLSCVLLAGLIWGVAAAVCALALRGFAFWKS
jgi:hypothetical protein